jgi:hypothetical protein
MPIDPSIPLGFRNPQIQVQNPVAQYAQAQELNLNALKMQEAQQSMANRNMLRSLDPSSPDYINQVSRMDPKLGLELSKGRTQARTAEIEQRTKIGGLMKQYANQVVANPTLDTALSVVQRFGRDTGGDMSDEIARLQTIGNNPDALRQWGMGYAMDADKILGQTTVTAAQKLTADVQREGQEITRQGQKLQYGPDIVANTVTDAAGNVTQFNRFGQVIGKPGAIGKPSATFEKTAALQKQQGRDLDLAIKELTEATKDKGLIDQSTGSGAGRLVDVAAGFAGQATPGAIAIAKLKPIADIALKMVPRFEGPQSDKDTQTYKEAAGQLADPSLPTQIRKEAGKEVLRLMKARKGQFVNEAMAAEGIGAGAPALPPGFTPDKP